MISIPRSARLLGLPGVVPLSAGLRVPITVLAAAAITGVALAMRLGLSPWMAGAQYITFFPAVILATLLFGPICGILAVAFSTVAATQFATQGLPLLKGELSLVPFVGVAAIDVAIISALLAVNAALKTSLAHAEDLNARLQVSEARFRGLIEMAPDAIVIADRQETIVLVNAEAERMLGYRRDELLGEPLDILMPPRFRAQHLGRVRHFSPESGPRRMGDGEEMLALRKDGSEIPIETNLSPLPGRDGLVCAVIRDISIRREHQERQSLLMGELNHRVKNTLASVQSIVSQTLRAAQNPRAFTDALTARIMALSQSHDVLTRNDWSGATVGDIVAEQLRPYERQTGPSFRLVGPGVKLTPNRAVTLGMVFGELATNAGKFGALSAACGTVEVTWDDYADPAGVARLRVSWSERGGPPVLAPTRRGFGARLIERSITSSLHGQVTLRHEPGGLVCEFDFPLLDEEVRAAASLRGCPTGP